MVSELTPRAVSLFLRPGDRVVVTGASGFIGSAIARALVKRSLDVVTISQPGASELPLDGVAVSNIETELSDQSTLDDAIGGARAVFHVSPDYRAKAHDPRSFQALNVEDTRRVLAAARKARCDKIVYTSSVATLGIENATMDSPADESYFPRIDQLVGLYKQSKYVAEHEVLREAAEGLPVTLVLPTTSVGEHDFTPTPSGRIILNYLNGHPANWFDTALNLVDVDDLAEGYVLAAERGGVGRSYILGGQNVAYRTLFALLEQCTGLQTRGFRVPRTAALAAATMSEFFEGRLLRKEPSVPIEGVRLATTPLIFSDQRARRELGYSPRPAYEAICSAAHWFADNGYVATKQLQSIKWGEPTPAAIGSSPA